MDDTLHIRPWADPVIDTIGHDPRSWYAETFWLPTLGPTCLLLLRRLADGFDRNPEGFVVATNALSMALGVGEKVTTGGPLRKALRRLEQFSLSSINGDGAVLVRRHLGPIHRKHVNRLPPVVRAIHHEFAEAQLARPPIVNAESRARRTALCLLGEGESPDCAERALMRMGFPITIARRSVSWATHHAVEAARSAHPAGSGLDLRTQADLVVP